VSTERRGEVVSPLSANPLTSYNAERIQLDGLTKLFYRLVVRNMETVFEVPRDPRLNIEITVEDKKLLDKLSYGMRKLIFGKLVREVGEVTAMGREAAIVSAAMTDGVTLLRKEFFDEGGRDQEELPIPEPRREVSIS